jgi:uncharacterized protein YqeY
MGGTRSYNRGMKAPQERIQDDLKESMKARDAERTGTLRMLLAEIKNEKIRLGRELVEEDFLGVVQKAVKQRQDAVEQYRNGGRPELAEKEEREAALLTTYLPEQLDEEQVRAAVEELVRAEGLAGPRDLGKVMGALVPRFKGRVDGKVLQRIARQTLGD